MTARSDTCFFNSNNTEMIDAHLPAILKQWPEVVAVYLFGSYATEDERGESDVDLALMFLYWNNVTSIDCHPKSLLKRITCAKMPLP